MEHNTALDFSIETEDIAKLQDQIRDSASIYATYSLKLEEITNKILSLTIDLKVLEAHIARGFREINPKISEAKIDRMLWDKVEFVDAQRSLNDLKLQEGKLRAVVRSLDKRHTLMVSTIPIVRGELRKIM